MEKPIKIKQAIDIIKNGRYVLGLTQSDVADRLNIGLRQYQKIEDGNFPKYKTQQITDLEKILNISIYELIYERPDDHVSEPFVPYHKQRLNKKINSGPLMVPLISIKAQAGYSKNYNNTDFIATMELYPIVPGIDPHGAIWRYFQVDGDSMLDFLNNGDYVLASQVPNEDWKVFKDFNVYVIVTENLVTIKYVAKRDEELILIPLNERHKQKLVPLKDVKEIWKYRRHIGWNASAGKKLEIKI